MPNKTEVLAMETKIVNIVESFEKRKAKAVSLLLKKELPQNIFGFKLKKVNLFDEDFNEYCADYVKRGSKIKMSLHITLKHDGYNLEYNLVIYDLDGADYSKTLYGISDADKVAKLLIDSYKKKL